jgi:hypothetical protein
MALPDPATSHAVLIGAASYESLAPLPAVANNLTRLTALLTDPDLWGLPPAHVTTLLDPPSRDEVMDAVHDAAVRAEDAIFVYFAGHGLLEWPSSALHLALGKASPEALHRAVRYDDVRREITAICEARSKVVVLDCCFSGQAMDGYMSASPGLADQARIDGTYLMTASAETAKALAEPGEKYTAFTGELVDAIERGVPDGPALLDMGTLYFQVRGSLLAKGRPEPQERARNDGRSIALLRNRWNTGTMVGDAQRETYVRPEPPPGWEHLLRRPPRDVLEAARLLRDENDDPAAADAVLAAAAGRWPGQSAAAMMQRLRGTERSADWNAVLGALICRPPAEVVDVLDALLELDEVALADAAQAALAAAPADHVAAVAAILAQTRGGGRGVALLDAAAAAHDSTRATLGLVAALWTAGLAEHIDRLLAAAAERMAADEVVDLADALRAMGREESAFGLYLRAVDVLGRRPPGDIVGVVQVMHAAGRFDAVQAVCRAAVGARGTAREAWQLAEALWSPDLERYALGVIESCAAGLPEEEIVGLLETLCTSEHGEAAFGYCSAAAAHGSAQVFVRLVETLRDYGRPVDANRLLSTLLAKMPDQAVEFIRVLQAAPGHARDVDRLLDAAFAGQADYAARFIAIWVYGETAEEVVPLVAHALRGRGGAGTLRAAARSGADARAFSMQLFHSLLDDPQQAAAGFEALIGFSGADAIEDLVKLRAASVRDIGSAIEVAVTFQQQPLAASVLDELLPADLDEMTARDPLTVLAVVGPLFQSVHIWGLPPEQIGACVPAKLATGLMIALRRHHANAAERLAQMIALHRAADDVPAVVRELYEARQYTMIKAILRVIELRRPPGVLRRISRQLRRDGLPTLDELNNLGR